MTLKELITSDVSGRFLDDNEFAQTVAYNGQNIFGIVDYGSNYTSGSVANGATLIVSATDVSSPSYRDTVVIDSTTWRVYQDDGSEIPGDGYMWEIPIIRNERPVL